MKLPAAGELYGRSIIEWVAKTPDTPCPRHVLLRILLRQNGCCAITGRKIRPGDKTAGDHITRLKDGGENRESNIQVIIVAAHHEKTGAENAQGAKERRIRLKHAGLWPKPSRPIRSRGFRREIEAERDLDT